MLHFLYLSPKCTFSSNSFTSNFTGFFFFVDRHSKFVFNSIHFFIPLFVSKMCYFRQLFRVKRHSFFGGYSKFVFNSIHVIISIFVSKMCYFQTTLSCQTPQFFSFLGGIANLCLLPFHVFFYFLCTRSCYLRQGRCLY